MQLYGVGLKIDYVQNVTHWFRPKESRSHWAIVKITYFYCDSLGEAYRKYKDLKIDSTYSLFDIHKTSENFEWFEIGDYKRVDESLVSVDVTCNIETLLKNMPCEDYRLWFYDKRIIK